jgi:hypothetical protein
MGSGPTTLTYLKTVIQQKEVEDSIKRKSSGFGYFLLVIPFLYLLPYLIVYELFSRRQHF